MRPAAVAIFAVVLSIGICEGTAQATSQPLVGMLGAAGAGGGQMASLLSSLLQQTGLQMVSAALSCWCSLACDIVNVSLFLRRGSWTSAR
jgi:pantothenate kinase-related protein Tda10